MEAIEVGSKVYQNNLVEEMRELRRLRTAVMMEKCLGKNEVVICPKPRRQIMRQCSEQTDLKVASELADIFMNKASPPLFAGSPPMRADNPLIQDDRFRNQMVQPSFGVNSVELPRSHSISTMG